MSRSEEKQNCFFCNNENAIITHDTDGEREYRKCPTCGAYIVPFTSFYLLDKIYEGLDAKRYDKQKLATYLFHNKIQERNAFVGTEEAFTQYRKHNPISTAFLVSPDAVENWYPKTFAEKIDKILLYLANNSLYNGHDCSVKEKDISYLFFMKNMYAADNIDWEFELEFFLKYFHDNKLVNNLERVEIMEYIENIRDDDNPFALVLSPLAWDRVYEIQKNQINNKNVFVAMKFGSETQDLRAKIKEGIHAAGYAPRIMDEIEHNHQIVPEMLYEIKNSRFVIAELSHHNNGAYYEAGYAYGLGKEVIHICQEDELSKGLHFDVKQVNTIVYKHIDEIPEKLKHRIKATIQ